MKKIIFIMIVIFVIALPLSACSNTSVESDSVNSEEANEINSAEDTTVDDQNDVTNESDN